eukprot:3197272-Pyramimonas_sp.AAC.1
MPRLMQFCVGQTQSSSSTIVRASRYPESAAWAVQYEVPVGARNGIDRAQKLSGWACRPKRPQRWLCRRG